MEDLNQPTTASTAGVSPAGEPLPCERLASDPPAGPAPASELGVSDPPVAGEVQSPITDLQSSFVNRQSSITKRRYTLSAKALEANRRNLEKARAAPKEKIYRPTPKRLAGVRANLIKAREGRRRKREQGRSTGIRTGLTCADLRAGLAMSGASPEELEAHRQLFVAQFAPRDDGEQKLVAAMADCAWRRQQVFHVAAVDEALLLKARLTLAARLGPARPSDLVLARLALDVFNSAPDMTERLGRLNRRFEKLAYLLLVHRDQEKGFGGHLRWGRSADQMMALDAAALGNPYLSARQLAEPQGREPPAMKPAADFEWLGRDVRERARADRLRQQVAASGDLCPPVGSVEVRFDGGRNLVVFGEGEPRRAYWLVNGTAHVLAEVSPADWPEAQEQGLVAELKREYLRMSADLRAVGAVAGMTLEDFLRVFDEGLAVPGEGREPASAAWERLRTYEDRAREEAAKLREILGTAWQSAREAIEQVADLFRGYAKTLWSACERAAELGEKLYELLIGRHGSRPEFGVLNPYPSWVWTDPEVRQQFLADLNLLVDPAPEQSPPEWRLSCRWDGFRRWPIVHHSQAPRRKTENRNSKIEIRN